MTASYSSGCRLLVCFLKDMFVCLFTLITYIFDLVCLSELYFKLFFWMQEPRAEGDAELCSSVNQYLNQPLGM